MTVLTRLGSVTLLDEPPALLRSLVLAVSESKLPQQFL
jgi:hypothetical protein